MMNVFFPTTILDIFSDFSLVIQIFILLTMMSFVFQHYGKNGWSYVLILILIYLIFFVIPGLSFGLFILQLLLTAGISSIIVDFFFVTQSHNMPKPKGGGGGGGGKEHGGDHGGGGGAELLQAFMKRGGGH